MVKYLCMSNMEEILSKLNPEQKKPVLDTEGAVLVIAGAGSGKTRVLTSRIAYLLQEKKVEPQNILAITFTNKAAKEMKERLEKMVEADITAMWVSTIHSMCVRILRQSIHMLGYDKNFTIYDETDRDRALKYAIELLGFDVDKYMKPARNLISMAKNECVSPKHFESVYADLHLCSDVAKIYEEYDSYLARSNALDFDDLLCKTYELFAKYPEVADYYAQKFEYIHIDEFQDTNKVQFDIINRLGLKHGNIFVVGDDDQSIYGWRGAKITNILDFDKLYVGAKVYKLEQNYRSSKKILQLANCIIANNTERRPKELWTENGDGAKIETFVANDENGEASYTAMQIKNLYARGVQYKDMAVFMRLNALSRAFEQEFTKYAIPYKVYGGFRFFERKEIKDILSYLKIVNNTRDDESFLRCVSFPKRGIGDKTLQELREFSTGKGLSLYDAIDFITFTTLSVGAQTKLINFKNLLQSFISFSKENSVPDLLNHILKTTAFLDAFAEKSEENESKKYNISELCNSAEEFTKANVGSNLSDYLASVTLSTDTDEINDGNCVTLATIHAVKGLEYDNVFIAGLDEKILPSARAYEGEESIEEERRLMYVAVTRARERLYLTRATSRYMYGRRDFMMPSRFLNEAKPVLATKPSDYGLGGNNGIRERFVPQSRNNNGGYDEDSGFTASRGGYTSSYAKSLLLNNKPKVSNANTSKYKAGIKVKHAKFGEGIVVSTKSEGDGLIVTVAFKGVGIKELSAKYAPMDVI